RFLEGSSHRGTTILSRAIPVITMSAPAAKRLAPRAPIFTETRGPVCGPKTIVSIPQRMKVAGAQRERNAEPGSSHLNLRPRALAFCSTGSRRFGDGLDEGACGRIVGARADLFPRFREYGGFTRSRTPTFRREFAV